MVITGLAMWFFKPALGATGLAWAAVIHDLAMLADELRAETISAVSETGGHLGASLGVVELTVADAILDGQW